MTNPTTLADTLTAFHRRLVDGDIPDDDAGFITRGLAHAIIHGDAAVEPTTPPTPGIKIEIDADSADADALTQACTKWLSGHGKHYTVTVS